MIVKLFFPVHDSDCAVLRAYSPWLHAQTPVGGSRPAPAANGPSSSPLVSGSWHQLYDVTKKTDQRQKFKSSPKFSHTSNTKRGERGNGLTVSHERRHDPVGHHVDNSWVDLVQLSRIDREDLVLDRPDVGLAVLDGCALARPGAHVGPAAVPERADKVDHAALGTQGRDCVLRPAPSLRVPQVAARDDPRCAVGRRVRVKCCHDRGAEGTPWARGLNVAVIVM